MTTVAWLVLWVPSKDAKKSSGFPRTEPPPGPAAGLGTCGRLEQESQGNQECKKSHQETQEEDTSRAGPPVPEASALLCLCLARPPWRRHCKAGCRARLLPTEPVNTALGVTARTQGCCQSAEPARKHQSNFRAFLWGPHQAMLRADYWPSAPGSLRLVVLRDP